MKFYIKSIFKFFMVIYLFASIGAASFITILENNVTLRVNIFWELLFSSFISAVISSLLLESQKDISKKNIIFRIALNFILIYIFIFASGLIFGWISLKKPSECIGFLIMFLGTYLGVWIMIYKRDNKVAEELNKKIKYYNNIEDIEEK